MLVTPFRCWLKRNHLISYEIIFDVVLKLVNSILVFSMFSMSAQADKKLNFR